MRPENPDMEDAMPVVRQAVERLLESIAAGRRIFTPESMHVDLKEEPNRRLNNGRVLPGHPRNDSAVAYLAGEVCCMANTPEGGALVLGVEDGSLHPIGTQLDTEWLVERLFVVTGVAVTVERRYLLGQRILIIWIPEADHPVTAPDGKLRWRIQDSCLAVEVEDWWRARWSGPDSGNDGEI